MLEQLFAGEDLVGRGGEKGQEVELLGREVDGRTVHRHAVRGPVDHEAVVLDLGRRLRRLAATQDGTDAGVELGKRARLHDVVVGTQVQKTDALGLLGTTGQDDDGQPAVAPEPGEHLLAVEAREPEVQDHQVVAAETGLAQRAGAVGGLSDAVSHPLEEQTGGGSARRVVLGD